MTMSNSICQPLTVVGTGRLGHFLVDRFASTRKVELLSARQIIAGDLNPLKKALARGGTVIFAHGKNVNVRRFRTHYDDLLRSRILPIEAVAKSGYEPQKVVLISSTVAFLSDRSFSLPHLQRTYENVFCHLFDKNPNSILRLGTVLGDGFQLAEGLQLLRSTLLLRHLRTSSKTNFPWADSTLLSSIGNEIADSEVRRRLIGAYESGCNLNEILDSYLGGVQLPLPNSLYALIMRLFGIRSEFLSTNVTTFEDTEWNWPAIRQFEQLPL
jgi:hypothetical protein